MQDDFEFLKRCAHNKVWPIRDKLTPSAEKADRNTPTWAQWFESKFGEDIETYHRRLYQQAQEKLYAR